MKRRAFVIILVLTALAALLSTRRSTSSKAEEAMVGPQVAAPLSSPTSSSSEGLGESAVSAPASPALVNLPTSTKELNALADGTLPLTQKMELLGRMMRGSNQEQAKAAAMRSVFIVKNAAYRECLQPLLLDATLNAAALTVLALNLHERPLDVMLPCWIAIRDQPGHPLHDEASDVLEFYLKNDAAKSGAELAHALQRYLTPAQQ
jgi:hypothetical protein